MTGDTVDGDEQVLALRNQAGVEVRVFNPFRYRGHNRILRAVEFAGNAKRLDYRMHNKLLVADNTLALIGGRNIGNEYFQVDPESQFADDDVFVAGPVVHALSATFDEYWNSDIAVPAGALGRPAAAHHSRRPPSLKRLDGEDYSARIASGEPFASLLDGRIGLVWATAHVLYDSPDKRTADAQESAQLVAKEVVDAAAQVQSEFLMINPYIVPTHSESALLADLRHRQIKVGIVTNSLQSTRDLLAYAGYVTSRADLLRQGIDLYEVRAQLGTTRGSGQTPRISRYGTYGLHGKLMVFDRQRIFVGSLNFDERSRHLKYRTEIGLIIDSPELAALTATRSPRCPSQLTPTSLLWCQVQRPRAVICNGPRKRTARRWCTGTSPRQASGDGLWSPSVPGYRCGASFRKKTPARLGGRDALAAPVPP